MGLSRTILASALVLSGCAAEDLYEGYEGDGHFVDHGQSAAAERYVVDFGEIDLATTGTRELTMSGLPPERFTIGLLIRSLAEPAQALYEAQPLGATLRLKVVNERGEVVISQEAPLGAWTWSGTVGEKSWSFVYLRGDFEGPPGGVDAGRGSYFTARPEGKYKVELEVIQPDPDAADYTVTARATGGGWKVSPDRD